MVDEATFQPAPAPLALDVGVPPTARMHYVYEHDLKSMRAASSEESAALAFATFFAGIFISVGIAVATAEHLKSWAIAVFVAIGLVCPWMCAWFLRKLLQARASSRESWAKLENAKMVTTLYVPVERRPS